MELDIVNRPIEFDISISSPGVDINASDSENVALVSVSDQVGQLDVIGRPYGFDITIENPVVNVATTDGSETVALVMVPGERGPAGPTFDGTAWWYGQGPPGTIVGAKPGDDYMDTLTGDVYKLGD